MLAFLLTFQRYIFRDNVSRVSGVPVYIHFGSTDPCVGTDAKPKPTGTVDREMLLKRLFLVRANMCAVDMSIM
jgi:hypothetical protein